MAVTQVAPVAQEKSTPYDEFNTIISKETFPATGMTADSQGVGAFVELGVPTVLAHCESLRFHPPPRAR